MALTKATQNEVKGIVSTGSTGVSAEVAALKSK